MHLMAVCILLIDVILLITWQILYEPRADKALLEVIYSYVRGNL